MPRCVGVPRRSPAQGRRVGGPVLATWSRQSPRGLAATWVVRRARRPLPPRTAVSCTGSAAACRGLAVRSRPAPGTVPPGGAGRKGLAATHSVVTASPPALHRMSTGSVLPSHGGRAPSLARRAGRCGDPARDGPAGRRQVTARRRAGRATATGGRSPISPVRGSRRDRRAARSRRSCTSATTSRRPAGGPPPTASGASRSAWPRR